MGGKVNYYANGICSLLCGMRENSVFSREHYFGFHTGSHYSMFSVEVLKAMGDPVCLGCKIAVFCFIIFFLLRTVVYCFQIQYPKKALFNVFINMLLLCYLTIQMK